MESKIIETAKGIFSTKNLKRAGIAAVIGAVLAGGGVYWHHQQESASKARVVEARTQMVRTQAEKEGLALLSENEVRTLVADAIGMDETAITYRRIELTENRAKGMKHDGDKREGDHRDGDHRDKKDKRDRKDHRGDGRMAQPQPAPTAPAPQAAPAVPPPDAAEPLAAPAAPAAEGAAAAPAPGAASGTAAAAPAPNRVLFQPVYNVKCYANNVKYKLILDAQTGSVLYREIDD